MRAIGEGPAELIVRWEGPLDWAWCPTFKASVFPRPLSPRIVAPPYNRNRAKRQAPGAMLHEQAGFGHHLALSNYQRKEGKNRWAGEFFL